MNKELLNEEHLRTLRHVTTYVTVGSAPFIQHNCPHQLGPQNINELAANVVSTVKSGLFRAATGFIGSWTGGNPDNEELKRRTRTLDKWQREVLNIGIGYAKDIVKGRRPENNWLFGRTFISS